MKLRGSLAAVAAAVATFFDVAQAHCYIYVSNIEENSHILLVFEYITLLGR